MSEEMIQHRLIQVQQATQRIQQADPWTFLLDSTVPAIAVSHSCEKIISQSNDDNFLQTLQSLQHLVLTCKDSLKTPILLSTITRLLLKNTWIEFYHHAKKAGVNQHHPFAVLLRQRPDMYFDLLEEFDIIFLQEPNQAWQKLKGFIYAVYLTEHQAEASHLLIRLQHHLVSHSSDEFRNQIYSNMVQLILNYPLQQESHRLLSLVDFLIYSHQPTQVVPELAYAFVDRLLAAVLNDSPVMPFLVRLERIMTLYPDALDPDLLWACLSFLLLKAQTVDQQQLLLQLIRSLCSAKEINAPVLRIAYLPLYQLLSELNDKEPSEQLKQLKQHTLHLISFLDQNKEKAWPDTNQLQEIAHSHTLYGPLSHIMIYMENIYSRLYPIYPIDDQKSSPVTFTLSLLFSIPFVFHEDRDIQCQVYSNIASLSEHYKFPVFLFLLRMLQSTEDPCLITHISRDVLLKLADTNDPVMSSKILQVLLSAIPSNESSVVASLAVKALGQLYQRQPRVWQELKRVFSDWVLRRKSGSVRRKVDLTQTGPIKMELAILTTMRDVVAFRPRECAPDILPMAVSLLQSCPNLSMASLSILMHIINLSVEANLAEPRSIWQVTVVYLAMFAAEQGTPKSNLLIKQLCRFYAMAGARDDPSEYYLQFKQTLLTDYLLPLTECGDTKAVSYALEALACFPSKDITIILPEKASDYIQQLVTKSDQPNPSQHVLLTTLVSDELDNMRRGLFKQDANIKPTVASQAHEESMTNELGQVIAERELELDAIFKTQWEDARVAPGLRSGYALAMLNTMDASQNQPSIDMFKTHWYRFMVTSFTDVSLTDHLLIRISSVISWESFFTNALRQAGNEMETMISELVKDLLMRLERSTVPGVTCNIFLALTGLVNMTRSFIPSFATSCASNIITVLMNNYISLAGSPLSYSAHLMSEEVQFAARFALGHLAGCIVSNESLTRQMYDTLVEAATNSNTKSRPIDTAVDLVQFANGYAASHYLSALAVYPVATEHVQELKKTGIKALLRYSESAAVSDSRVLGILMGFASRLKAGNVEGDVLDFATQSLERYLTGSFVSKGRLFGSTWVCATGALQEHQVDYHLSNIIESTLAAASTDNGLAQHFYHFTVPYATVQYHNHLCSNTNEQAIIEFYQRAFEPLFHSIQSDDASSNYRVASLFAVGSLLGINYLSSFNRTAEIIVLEAQRYHALARRPGIDKLGVVAGLTVRSAPTGNLKSGRVAAAVCGKAIEHAKELLQTLKSDSSEPTDVDSPSSSAVLMASSSEPTSYNRLNSNTSYLKAIFEQLNQTTLPNTINMFLKSLIHTPGPLPPVNWFSLMLKLVKTQPEQCLQFASAHASTSFSLSEFLVMQTNSALSSTSQLCSILFEKTNAFGAILELAGLTVQINKTKDTKMRRGMNAIIKKIHLSESRLLELIDLIGQKFFYLTPSTQEALLITLKQHLPGNTRLKQEGEEKAQLIQSIRHTILQSITLPLLNNKESNDIILKSAVECSITQVNQLLHTGTSKDWSEMPVESMYTHLFSLCTLYRQQSDQKQLLVKHISAAISVLICRLGEIATTEMDPWHFWSVISSCISSDCPDLKETLGWIIRVLDAFVVFASTCNTSDSSHDQDLYDGIYIGLCQILSDLSSSFSHPSDNRLEAMETVYLLNAFILNANHHKTEQEQIVKRVFKLLDMTSKLQARLSAEFFECVVLGLPKEYINQNEWRY